MAAGEFVEHAVYAGNSYGTLRTELERPARGIVLEIDVQGARQVRETLPEAVLIFIEPPSFEALDERLTGRGSDSPEQIERRLAAAREELAGARRVRPPRRATTTWSARCRSSRSWPLPCVRRDQAPSRQAARAGRLPLRRASWCPRSAPGRSTPTTTTSARGPSTSTRRRWWRRARRTTSRSPSRRSPPGRSSTATARRPWPGILLGVSGGIAAYKAVELVRLATAAGHAVRVVQTPASLQFVGRATFEGVTGAPVLVDEFEPDPARGAFPGDPAPDHDPISHLELVARCDAFVVAPASANTLAKLAARAWPTTCSPAPRWPAPRRSWSRRR